MELKRKKYIKNTGKLPGYVNGQAGVPEAYLKGNTGDIGKV